MVTCEIKLTLNNVEKYFSVYFTYNHRRRLRVKYNTEIISTLFQLGLYYRPTCNHRIITVKSSCYFGSLPATTFWKTPMQAACLPWETSGEDTSRSSAANDFIDTLKWPNYDTHTHTVATTGVDPQKKVQLFSVMNVHIVHPDKVIIHFYDYHSSTASIFKMTCFVCNN